MKRLLDSIATTIAHGRRGVALVGASPPTTIDHDKPDAALFRGGPLNLMVLPPTKTIIAAASEEQNQHNDDQNG